MSEIIPPAPPCFCLPASPVRQDGVNGKIMPEAKGEGESACRNAVFQRTGAPGDVRSPADGHKQAGFTPAVKRNARRASDAGRKA